MRISSLWMQFAVALVLAAAIIMILLGITGVL